MKYKRILTIMLALVMLIGSVTPVIAETRGDPILKTIGGEDDLVVAEPPNMPGISEDDKLIAVPDPNSPSGKDGKDDLLPGVTEGNDPVVPGNDGRKRFEDNQGKGDWTRPDHTTPKWVLTKTARTFTQPIQADQDLEILTPINNGLQ